jgi:Uma2 family endonuclease
MTVDEWRALERDSHDVKHEYIDGYVYAMAGGSRAHMHIASNVVSVLNGQFGDGPCIAYALDLATRISASRYTYPDVVVTCADGDQPTTEETEVFEPRVVVEVLSDSTEHYDRTLKFAYYRECPSGSI